MSHRLVLGGTTQLQSTDPRAERTITSFMREADNNDVGNSDSTGGVSNDVHSSNGLNDGETDGEGPDERAARSELAHSHVLRGFSLEPDGSNAPELDGSNAEAALKISAQMSIPEAGRMWKRSVASQFNGTVGRGDLMSPDRLKRVCQAVAETQGDSLGVEDNSVGLQSDVAVIFEAHPKRADKHYCVWYGRVQRMFKLISKKKKIEYKKPMSLLSKPKDVMSKLH